MTRHTTAWFDARRLLVWSLANAGLVACGALEGGQSGTDSLEAIGVNKPLMKCEEGDAEHATGEKVMRHDGCEECVCQGNGKWKCAALETCADAANNDQGAADGQSTTQTQEGAPQTGVASSSDPNTDAPPDDSPEQFCEDERSGPSIGGSNAVYIAKDPDASVCVAAQSSTSLCMTGSIVDAGEDYANWGGGFGVVMASQNEDVITPFDAPSRGIVSARFTLTGVNQFTLRAYVNQVNDPDIENDVANYIQNGFVLLETSESGTFTLPLVSAALPAWTQLDTDGDGMSNPDVAIDVTKLNSLSFLIASQVGPGSGFLFDVCVKDLEWLDENGNTVLPAE